MINKGFKVKKSKKKSSFLRGRFSFWAGGWAGWKLPVAAGVFVATETGSGLVLALMEHGQKL